MEINIEQSRLCSLCENSLSEGEIVCVQKGISTLVVASKKRGDGKWKNWTRLSSVQVHAKCRKDCTREKSIAASERKDKTNQLKVESPIRQKLRSKQIQFDLENMSVAKGMIGDDIINSCRSYEIRMVSMNAIIGKKYY